MKVACSMMALCEPEQDADCEHGQKNADEVFRDSPIEKILKHAFPSRFPTDFAERDADA